MCKILPRRYFARSRWIKPRFKSLRHFVAYKKAFEFPESCGPETNDLEFRLRVHKYYEPTSFEDDATKLLESER